MLMYIVRRLALAVVTCVAISIQTFIIIRLPPGDFVDAYIANLAFTRSSITAEQAQAMRAEYGLDRPVYVRYALWISRVVEGDLGVSMIWRRPVTEAVGDRLWLTKVISFAALFLTRIIALPIGIYNASSTSPSCLSFWKIRSTEIINTGSILDSTAAIRSLSSICPIAAP